MLNISIQYGSVFYIYSHYLTKGKGIDNSRLSLSLGLTKRSKRILYGLFKSYKEVIL